MGHGPEMTNNLAEYRAVYEAAKWAAENGIQCEIRTDSQLVAKQIAGDWKCNNPRLQKARDLIRDLLKQCNGVVYWIPRAQNERADALTRRAYTNAKR